MDVELRQLRAFVAVVDEGTFTDAAIALDVSQATVSRTIASLERALGAAVLHRTSREVGLTVTGARVLPHARGVLARVGALEQALAATGGDFVVGYAWGALGRHTREAQRRWADGTGSQLVFEQSMDRTGGLDRGIVQAAVVRRRLDEDRYELALLGVEQRYAALPADDPLARRRRVSVTELLGRTVAIDPETGTTTAELWPADAAPSALRPVHGVDAWLTLIEAGQGIGITTEATVARHTRRGVVYRPLRDAPPQPVWLAWPRELAAPGTDDLVRLARELYAGDDAG